MGEGRLVVVVPPILPNVFASPGLPTLARLADESLLGSKSSRARSALAAAARLPMDLEARRDGVPGPPRRMEVGAMEEKADLVGVLRSKTQESRERAVVVVEGLGALLERKAKRKGRTRQFLRSRGERNENEESETTLTTSPPEVSAPEHTTSSALCSLQQQQQPPPTTW